MERNIYLLVPVETVLNEKKNFREILQDVALCPKISLDEDDADTMIEEMIENEETGVNVEIESYKLGFKAALRQIREFVS